MKTTEEIKSIAKFTIETEAKSVLQLVDFVDDELVFQVSPEDYNSNYFWPFNDSQWYIILNLAITPNYPPNNQTLFPSEMQIDWVRVFSL